ncbi:MAG TPA: ABC transporter substrate-binding protein [Candidatus Ratteibacteria bacterium]|jgi:peptide/nickel transport system substrate-binding protein|uniref:ABC transporter-binding protein n=1 Tax=candidate division TA06 bacterium ADurb.Bin131 TaxID=1852827 RepID=A0A1V6CD58_UNCT6|nr:MAG: putative ABC transporter-binding protein precursor [candidate division TA06 bacterium ADurb.Bin131]HON06118.1 ABC transporter substrate-binding protein [bacterium]HRS06758.1 ABC transporter substrate-binding protein [Candidatus Ratteibacteria bacterium]HOQ81954.1 ABC transporter substrate-binding protein [bacterium]HPC29873.1 ABC transporter substrate-binding protein [bacterium]
MCHRHRIISVLFLVLLICAGGYSASKYGGTLVISSSSIPKSFNPIIAKETSTTFVTGFMFEGLTTTDAITQQVKPNLAKSWKVSQNGKEWTFYLRKDVFWNDGIQFTAYDVKFTFDMLIFNPDIPTSSRDVFTIGSKNIQIKIIDRFTVMFILPDRFAPFLRLMGQEILPEHKYRKIVNEKKFSFAMGLDSNPQDIVGTGPFMLEDFRPGEWVILSRNKHYWKHSPQGDTLPYLDRIIILTISDQNLALLKFRKGEIDMISLRAQDYLLLRKAKISGIKFFNVGPSPSSEFLVFNQNLDSSIPDYKKKWFRNINFRKAVSCAIDRKTIINNIFAGFGYPLYGPVNESVPEFYNPKIKKFEYNLDKAKEYLSEAGFYKKNDGLLYDSSGNQICFSLLTNSNNSERIEQANLIRNDLEKLGMKVNFSPVDFNSLVTRINVTKDWEAIMIGLTGGIDPHFGKNVWTTQGHLHLWNLGSPRSVYEWEKEVDRIFEEAARQIDYRKRKMLYDRWQEIMCENQVMTFTVTSAVLYATKDKFGNLKPTVYGGLFHNIEEIYIKK